MTRWLACALLAAACSRSPAVQPAAPPPAPPAHPPPYGFWGLNGHVTPAGLADVKARFGVTIFHTSTTDPAWAVGHLLPMVRAAGLKVTLRMTGSHERYTTPGGDFDRAAWEAMLAPWGAAGLGPFIADGTLAGHMILDDIANFEGRDPDAADLDAMARYSESLFPDLMTFVRENATEMPAPEGGRYLYVDACVNQYKASEGDVAAYAAREAAHARRLGLGIINGLNIANGGDGSSGQPGWQRGRHAMSAEEIARYGAVLAATPGVGMFLCWEYDSEERWPDGSVGGDYFDRPALQAALADLGRVVARQPPAALRSR